MIGLTKGQEIFNKFKVQSKMGPGVLYLLNTGLAFEVSGKGLALELSYDDIKLVREIKETLLVSWMEGKESYDIKFSVKDANKIVEQIISIKNKKGSYSHF